MIKRKRPASPKPRSRKYIAPGGPIENDDLDEFIEGDDEFAIIGPPADDQKLAGDRE